MELLRVTMTAGSASRPDERVLYGQLPNCHHDTSAARSKAFELP